MYLVADRSGQWVCALLGLLSFLTGMSQSSGIQKVAIIGAGIGGSATAHYVRQLLGNQVAIHVYEQSWIGGRLRSAKFQDSTYELGGSMVYEDNYHVRALADDVGLQRVDSAKGNDISDPLFALYDGSSFVYNQSSWSAINMARMLLRYGTAPLRFQGKPKAMFDLFKSIYDMQANGTCFDTPEELLKRTQLYNFTQQSTHQYLERVLGTDKHSRRFASEFIAAINRVNYNQGNTLNALAGMVSMLPAVDSRVFKIKGGNQLLPQRLLLKARAHVKRGWSVEEVRGIAKGCFQLHATKNYSKSLCGLNNTSKQLPWEQVVSGPYAAVVVAAPLEHSNLKFHGAAVQRPPDRSFQKVVTSFVAGTLRGSYFGTSRLPADQILTTEDADTPFSVVSPIQRLSDGQTLYKLFSQSRLGASLIRDMFDNATEVDHHSWNAYPVLRPPQQFAPFRLAPGIFYNNAIESAASAMEMSAIAAKNSALLVARHLADTASLHGFDMLSAEQ